MDRIHGAHGPHVTRSPEGIPFLVINISYESTLGTDEVVMAVCVCIKPRSLPEGPYARDESFLSNSRRVRYTVSSEIAGIRLRTRV